MFRATARRFFISALTASTALTALPALAQTPIATSVVYSGWQQSLADAGPWLTPLAALLGPIIGFGMVCLTLMIGLQRFGTLKKQQDDRHRHDEQALIKRERYVLVAALAGELTENKIKCEAFITIYSELLRNLRDTDRKALYEETGDFIHQHPPLSRKVFDANVDKISNLGAKLAGDIAGVYAAIRSDAEYFTLDAGMPRANAIRMVEMILDDAQRTLEPMDSIITALNMIVRDGAGKANGSKQNA